MNDVGMGVAMARMVLWQARHQCDRVTVGMAVMARVMLDEHGGACEDPAMMNPFAAYRDTWPTLRDLQADLPALAAGFGLADDLASYLVNLFDRTPDGMWTARHLAGLDCREIVCRVQAAGADHAGLAGEDPWSVRRHAARGWLTVPSRTGD